MLTILLASALAYLLGSVPFGLVLTRLAGTEDIRQIGSGNIGATNVLRTGKKGLALLTLLLDGGKGMAAVLLAAHFAPEATAFAGFAALLGHVFPVWLRFKGGKGVATSIGVMIGAAWPAGLLATAIWIATVLLSRYSSLGAIVAISLLAPLAYVFNSPETLPLALALTALVLVKHAANIRRLLNGTEPKIGKKP